MRISDNVLDLIGDTPLVRLDSSTKGVDLVAKVEYFNPGGSSKDRIAQRLVSTAEDTGELKPGGIIVEATSGNTGVGLALVAQQRGYKCVFTCPDKVSLDKIDTLRAYGAEVIVCPTKVEPDDPTSYYSVANKYVADNPGAWRPNQYDNQAGPMSHYLSTGPEIWKQTEGKITHFVAGVGTGGTISGTGKYLKEISKGQVKVIGVEPEGSIYNGGTAHPYLTEGVGEDFWPKAFHKEVTDEIITVSDSDAFATTRLLAKQNGLLVGGSSGMAVFAAKKLAKSLSANALIVVLLPDSGRGYMSSIFNDEWMLEHDFTL